MISFFFCKYTLNNFCYVDKGSIGMLLMDVTTFAFPSKIAIESVRHQGNWQRWLLYKSLSDIPSPSSTFTENAVTFTLLCSISSVCDKMFEIVFVSRIFCKNLTLSIKLFFGYGYSQIYNQIGTNKIWVSF